MKLAISLFICGALFSGFLMYEYMKGQVEVARFGEKLHKSMEDICFNLLETERKLK